MPNYSLECPECRKAVERYCPISERNKQRCDACNARLKRVFGPTRFSVWKEDWYWFDTKTKKRISSKRQLLDECERREKVSIGYG